jgi:histidinol-phosphate phosphatase family protein
MKAVILAGGKGTRLGPLTKKLPKPMVPIGDMPLLEHQVRWLCRYGLTDIILSTGYHAESIRSYFRNGKDWGVSLSYIEEHQPLGTAGALRQLDTVLTDDFLVLYGDIMLDVNLERLLRFHRQLRGAGTLVVHPNDHPEDSDLVEIDADSRRVQAFHPKPHAPDRYYRNLVNAGLYVLSPRVFSYLESPSPLPLSPRESGGTDLGRHALPRIVPREPLYGYVTAEYLKDMGTPARLRQVTADFRSGRIARLNNRHPRRAVFLDRDGVLNRYAGLIHRPDDLELLPGVVDGVRALNAADFLTIVVTNQPVIARNLCSREDLERIHGKLEMLLGRGGAKLDAIYSCPHHPDKGYVGENPAYKVSCACRKPATGMIQRAAEEFNVQLAGSYLIGDSARDFECGRRAGLTTIGLRTGEGWPAAAPQPDFTFSTFREAANHVLDLGSGAQAARAERRSLLLADSDDSAICHLPSEICH